MLKTEQKAFVAKANPEYNNCNSQIQLENHFYENEPSRVSEPGLGMRFFATIHRIGRKRNCKTIITVELMAEKGSEFGASKGNTHTHIHGGQFSGQQAAACRSKVANGYSLYRYRMSICV